VTAAGAFCNAWQADPWKDASRGADPVREACSRNAVLMDERRKAGGDWNTVYDKCTEGGAENLFQPCVWCYEIIHACLIAYACERVRDRGER
jgi:hypothetical protein